MPDIRSQSQLRAALAGPQPGGAALGALIDTMFDSLSRKANIVAPIKNLKPSNTRRLRKAKANVIAGLSNGVVAFLGDSTTMGDGAGTGTNGFDGARPLRPTVRAAAQLNKRLLTCEDRGWFGAQGVPAIQQATYDTRISIGSGWATTSAGIAGAYYQNSTTTNALAFTPIETFDTLEIWYIQGTGLGTFTVDVDGDAALETIDSATPTTSALVHKTYTGLDLDTHVINFKRTTGGNTRIAGWRVSNSATTLLELRNLGVAGATAATGALSTNPWSSLNALVAMAPDALFINLGMNDLIAGTSLTAFDTSYQSILDAMRATTDCILVSPNPRGLVSGVSLATQLTYVAAIEALAERNDLPLLDLRSLYETQEIADALGLYYDTTHPNSLGYIIMADAYAKAIEAA